ncbi:hypothetical protein H4219_005296 [Mycoemilia scoparia]|uniref:G-patch domain-containing protein n=1 Tax=Mycoemilia scoparia TaxID=417184 RepID=A0A9W7ZPQ2_9FUNG|nr:hypothetical protein H4219_005296 [Mycoemilia scoparia]
MTLSFAEAQLAKYGWKKGEGLGKNNEGITRAISIAMKQDVKGVGVDSNQWDNDWWSNIYNKASGNVQSDKKKSTNMNTDNNDNEDTENHQFYKSPANFNINNPELLYHSMFVKSSATPTTFDEAEKKNSTKIIDSITALTDAELFAACEGRTARKGARGEQPGKLKRTNGDGMPRLEVVKMIEAAMSGQYNVESTKTPELSTSNTTESSSQEEHNISLSSDRKKSKSKKLRSKQKRDSKSTSGNENDAEDKKKRKKKEKKDKKSSKKRKLDSSDSDAEINKKSSKKRDERKKDKKRDKKDKGEKRPRNSSKE